MLVWKPRLETEGGVARRCDRCVGERVGGGRSGRRLYQVKETGTKFFRFLGKVGLGLRTHNDCKT